MFAPPVPLIVNAPGARKVPFESSCDWPDGSVNVPFGPVIVKLDPASALP
jgi:hypothetical protein